MTRNEIIIFKIIGVVVLLNISIIAAVVYFINNRVYTYNELNEEISKVGRFDEMNFFDNVKTVVKSHSFHSSTIYILGNADIKKIEKVVNKYKLVLSIGKINKKSSFDWLYNNQAQFEKFKEYFDYSEEWTFFHLYFIDDGTYYAIAYNNSGGCLMRIIETKKLSHSHGLF